VAGSGSDLELKYTSSIRIFFYLLSEAELLDQEAVSFPLPLGLAVQESPPDVMVALPALRRLHLGPSVVNHTLQGYAVHGWLWLKHILIFQTKDPESDIFPFLCSSPLSIPPLFTPLPHSFPGPDPLTRLNPDPGL
jgi:hypothetical protein